MGGEKSQIVRKRVISQLAKLGSCRNFFVFFLSLFSSLYFGALLGYRLTVTIQHSHNVDFKNRKPRREVSSVSLFWAAKSNRLNQGEPSRVECYTCV